MALYAKAWLEKAEQKRTEILGHTPPCRAHWVCCYQRAYMMGEENIHGGGFYQFPSDIEEGFAGRWAECPWWKHEKCPRRIQENQRLLSLRKEYKESESSIPKRRARL